MIHNNMGVGRLILGGIMQEGLLRRNVNLKPER